MIASTGKEMQETNTAETGVKAAPRAVRSAVIYGANASGKSNLLRAMRAMSEHISNNGHLRQGDSNRNQPFRLNNVSVAAPTFFEVTFLLENVRYRYGFETNAETILSEWLLVFKNAKPQNWIDRTYADGHSQFKSSDHLAGPKRLWEEATRPDVLFLSNAAYLNSEQLFPLVEWLENWSFIFQDGHRFYNRLSVSSLENSRTKSFIIAMLLSADAGISSVRVAIEKRLRRPSLRTDTENVDNFQRPKFDVKIPIFQHGTSDEAVEFDLADESEGTQKLFALAGKICERLENGQLLVIDELESSLHPLLVRKIVEIFHDPELNKNGAQLVFTTHNTSLLDTDLFRRDQIWFAEKRADQSSELIPLTAFSARKGEALAKNYLAGRYGGVPVLRDKLVSAAGNGE